MTRHTAQSIARQLGGQLIGPEELRITGLADTASAAPGQMTYITDARYARTWPQSQASAALVSRDIQLDPDPDRAIIVVDNAELAMAKALELFQPPLAQPEPGVHESAVVDATAYLGQDVSIGPHCVIGPDASIGDRAVVHAGVTIMQSAVVGQDSLIWPGVVIRDRCTLGDRCIIHPNVVIGADGFGYRPAADRASLIKIPHIGTVRIGNDVEIGANSCVDRGKFAATVIGDGTKIDNLVQIAHNCRIGKCVIIAGHSALAGSVTIGDGCVLGGMVAVKDHLTLGPGVTLAGCTQVIHDVPAGETWAGSPACPARQAIQQVQALRKLPDIIRQYKRDKLK